MNSSKSKNNVLYLARHNSAQQYMLWADRLKKSLAGEDLARQEVEHEPAAGSWSKENQQHPGAQQAALGRWSFSFLWALLRPQRKSYGQFCEVQVREGSSRRRTLVRVQLRGTIAGRGLKHTTCWGAAERCVFVQSGEEMPQGTSHCYLQLLDQKRRSQTLLRSAQ